VNLNIAARIRRSFVGNLRKSTPEAGFRASPEGVKRRDALNNS
jgi:hypothetical protein